MGVSIVVCSVVRYFCNHLDGEERAGCFAWFVFLVSSVMGLSAVRDSGIS